MVVAVILISIAGFLVVAGVVVAAIGFFMRPSSLAPQSDGQKPSFIDVILDLIKQCFAYMFGADVPREKKIQAFGVFLLLMGIGFLVASGVAAVITIATGGGAGGGSSPSSSPSNSAS